MPRSWGFWTRYKLEILKNYLDAFTTTTKNHAQKRVYLDLFAGELDNFDRDTGDPIEGSARVALNTENPAFSHFQFFELPPKTVALEAALKAEFPDRNWKVYADCNQSISQALIDLHIADAHWAPTFAFIDPNGPHYTWGTLIALAAHKGPKAKTKVELWMLFPDPLFARLLPKTGDLRPKDNRAITDMYGDSAWHAIWQAKLSDQVDAASARTEYVNLMRWRLERELGYKWTHQLEIYNTGGVPIYHMVFATDSDAGHRIMTNLYNTAAREFPDMVSHVRAERQRAKREAQGVYALFEMEGTPVSGTSPQALYVHEAPDEPRSHDATTCAYCG